VNVVVAFSIQHEQTTKRNHFSVVDFLLNIKIEFNTHTE